MLTPRRVVAGLFAALLALPALAVVEKTGESSASFSGVGPAGFKMEGKTSDLEIKEDGKSATVTVPLANLKTGIELRDKHMREKYLEVQKYPNAVLTFSLANVTFPSDTSVVRGKGTGTFSLHGKTKELPFKYTLQRKGEVYFVTGTLPVNLKDFDIHIPSYLGVTLKPDIDTTVAFQFKKT